MTAQVTADAAGRHLRELTSALRRGVGRQVAHTVGYNVAAAAAASLGSIIVARALGPEMRGEYSAVTSWFGVMFMIGTMGQPGALCFYIASDPDHARGYVATSRAMMLGSGIVALAGGILLAPLLARGNAGLTVAYRIAFAASIVAFVGANYTFSLQARNLRWWNKVRVSQPVLSLAFLVVLWRLRMLTLNATLIVLGLTMFLQLGWAYYRCRSAGLVPGHAQARLVRPLARYGASQIAAVTPATLNANLDQLVLSQTVAPAVLGRYAIAVSWTLLPIMLVSAIGSVAFPRLASRQRVDGAAGRMQWLGILGSACAAAVALVPLDLVAPWLIPRLFGPGYDGVVPLLWALTPAGVLLACNQVTADVLRGRKRPMVVARAEGLAAVFTVILLVVLLPVAGVYGAAIASTVAYGVALVVMLLCLRRLPSDSSGPRHRRRPGDKDTSLPRPPSDTPGPKHRRRPAIRDPYQRVRMPGDVRMIAIRRVVGIATDLTCQAVGKRTVVRTVRFVMPRAGLEYPNELSTNGESALQRWILRFSQAGKQIHVADVGANVGRWSE